MDCRQRRGFTAARRKRRRAEDLLQAGAANIVIDKRLENCEHVAAIFDHALQNVAQGGLALGFTMPASQHLGRHLNVAPKFVGRMPAQKQAVKEGGFPLRVFKLPLGLFRDDGCAPHEKSAVYRNWRRRQEGGWYHSTVVPGLPALI